MAFGSDGNVAYENKTRKKRKKKKKNITMCSMCSIAVIRFSILFCVATLCSGLIDTVRIDCLSRCPIFVDTIDFSSSRR